MSLELLIDRYCLIWCETDVSRRAELLESVWAAGGTYTDPTTGALGKAELLAHIARVQATRPGATVQRTTGIDEHHGVLRFGFHVVDQDGTVLRHGTDFVVLDDDRQRLRRVVGFFGDLTAL
jgi:hypothetical protein